MLELLRREVDGRTAAMTGLLAVLNVSGSQVICAYSYFTLSKHRDVSRSIFLTTSQPSPIGALSDVDEHSDSIRHVM